MGLERDGGEGVGVLQYRKAGEMSALREDVWGVPGSLLMTCAAAAPHSSWEGKNPVERRRVDTQKRGSKWRSEGLRRQKRKDLLLREAQRYSHSVGGKGSRMGSGIGIYGLATRPRADGAPV